MTIAIHQFVPSMRPRDAVASHAQKVSEILRDAGIESRIFAEHADGASTTGVSHFREFRGGSPRTWLLYQLSTGSPLARFLLGRPEPRIVAYHNVTPASYFTAWEPMQGLRLQDGRREMRQLAAGTALGLAVSAFNRSELDSAGYRRTAIVPVLVDRGELDAEVDRRRLDTLLAAKGAGGPDLLFVGRLAPNKCQHDLVKAVAAYRHLYGVPARLHLVGEAACPPYRDALHAYVRHLGLSDAVYIHGSVPPGALAAHYRSADVFVCLSEHEGFCVPLLEAWHHRLPILGFAAGAVPETLNGAGLLLTSKEPARVAAAVHRLVVDGELRQRLVSAGIARLEEFSLERSRRTLLARVGEIVAEAA